MSDFDYPDHATVEFHTKASGLINALSALAPLCAKTLIKVTVLDEQVRLEACTKGLGGVVHLHAMETMPGEFVIPADYVAQLAKVFTAKDYAAGGHLAVAADPARMTFRVPGGKQLELEAPFHQRVDEPAQVVLAQLLGEYGTSGSESAIVLDPDRARVVLLVSKLILGDVVMRQPEAGGPTFISIGSTFAGYVREPGWYDGAQTEDGPAVAGLTVIAGQSDIFEELS